MELAQAKEASELLIRHWQGGTTSDALPLSLRPQTRAEGLFDPDADQHQTAVRLEDSRHEPGRPAAYRGSRSRMEYGQRLDSLDHRAEKCEVVFG